MVTFEDIYNKFFPLWFQDPATSIMEGIVGLHNYIFFYITLVLFFVLWILLSILFNFLFKLRFLTNEGSILCRYSLSFGNSIERDSEYIKIIFDSVYLLFISFNACNIKFINLFFLFDSVMFIISSFVHKNK